MKKLNDSIDPRKIFIKERYKEIKNIIAFSSGKGGVGKSTICAFSALQLAQLGYNTGLLDLDLYGPSSHIILQDTICDMPEEKHGVIPRRINGVHFMSVVYFSGNKPMVMRGHELGNAVLELLTIINWPALDFLLIDMPPGLGDTMLEITELLSAKYIVITNSTKISMESVEKLIEFLKEQNLPLMGIIENMKINKSDFVKSKCEKFNIQYIGSVKFYPDIEDFYGQPKVLGKSEAGKDIQGILNRFAGI